MFWISLLVQVSVRAPIAEAKPAGKIKIKLAVLFSKSGADSLIEREIKRGVQVFEKVYPEKAEGLKISFFDNHGTLEGTLTQLKKIKEDEINFVIGLRNNEEALAAAQFAEENDLLFLTPTATFSRIGKGRKNSFQLSANEVLYGAALGKFTAEDLKRKRVLVLLNQRSVFSQGFSESFQKVIKSGHGIEIAEHISNGRDLNLDGLKKRIREFKPDLVFISDNVSNSAILTKYIHRLDPLIPFLTGASFGSEQVMRILLKEVPKIRIYYTALWNENDSSSINETFKQNYSAQFAGEAPSADAALTFDAMSVLNDALDYAGGAQSVDKVRYFLEHLRFQTTQGGIDFVEGPTHSPIKDVHIRVSNVSKSKWIKTLRTKWNPKL